LPLSSSAGCFYLNAAGDTRVTMATTVEIKVVVVDLIPITSNQRPWAFWAIGALSRDIMHVADLGVFEASLHCGVAGEWQDLARS